MASEFLKPFLDTTCILMYSAGSNIQPDNSVSAVWKAEKPSANKYDIHEY